MVDHPLFTDAEGRLLLADAICYVHSFTPTTIVDLATHGHSPRDRGSWSVHHLQPTLEEASSGMCGAQVCVG